MKKFFIAIVALAAAVACSNDDIISIDRQTIGFGNAFVDNATRIEDPSYGADNLIEEFYVWGTVKGNTDNTLNLYNGARVYDNSPEYGTAYTCDQTEYWIPSATYNFVAVANATSVAPATGLPTTISYTADGTSDLLYTTTGVTAKTNAQAEPTEGVNGNNVVAFTFNHLLSKIHFEFVNASGSDKCKFEITDIKVYGQNAAGTYDIANQTWTANGTIAVDDAWNFGGAANITDGATVTSEKAFLFVPGNQTLNISFTKNFYYDGTPSNTETVTATLTNNFAANGAYVIKATLKSGKQIDFSVGSLGGWDSDTSITIP